MADEIFPTTVASNNRPARMPEKKSKIIPAVQIKRPKQWHLDFDAVVIDPDTVLASIFRPRHRGRRPQGMNVTTVHPGYKLKWLCYEWLDEDDQYLMFVACGLAGVSSMEISHQAKDEIDKQLWLDLKTETNSALLLDDDRLKTVYIESTLYKLIKAVGLPPNGNSYEQVRDSLERLCSLHCSVREDSGAAWSMRMLSTIILPDGSIRIALNSRLAQAVLSGLTGIRQNMIERECLTRNTGKKANGALLLTHALVSVLVPEGTTKEFGVDGLVDKIYGVRSKSAATHRGRRAGMVEALESIGKLDVWKVHMIGSGANARAVLSRARAIVVDQGSKTQGQDMPEGDMY